ncbi:MAG: PQQ-like beta-propeller repeat protein [Chloroflexota bacterium]|nr:PQQ-like beta-propeller repeat protein [Chloroflexota bacterium]
MTGEPQRSAVQYPGGLAARYRWGGSAQAEAIFGLSESGGVLVDHGPLVAPDPDRLCRAELRVEGPGGTWTARFASPIFDAPQGMLWDTAGVLVVKYGFAVYALNPRTGELRWMFTSGAPLLAVLGSSRLPHVIAQSEVDTVALRANGEVAWRAAHSDVVVEADLVGGRLILTSYDGDLQTLDPLSGQPLPAPAPIPRT